MRALCSVSRGRGSVFDSSFSFYACLALAFMCVFIYVNALAFVCVFMRMNMLVFVSVFMCMNMLIFNRVQEKIPAGR